MCTAIVKKLNGNFLFHILYNLCRIAVIVIVKWMLYVKYNNFAISTFTHKIIEIPLFYYEVKIFIPEVAFHITNVMNMFCGEHTLLCHKCTVN